MDSTYWEVREGWFPIVANAIKQLEEINPNIEILQVKEKFGGLRIYADDYSEAVENIIKEAEKDAYKTCENCGSTENVSTKGSWIKTFCESCRVKR